jgi:hypothetical protein
MEGCEDAQKFVKELVPVKQAQVQAQAAARAQAEAQARQVQNSRGPPPVLGGGGGKGSLESEARELARKKQLMLAGREMLVEGNNMIEEAKQMLRAQGHVVEGDEVPVLPPLASGSGSGGKKAGK